MCFQSIMPEINLLEFESFFYAKHIIHKEPTSQEIGYPKHIMFHLNDEIQISH